MNEIINPTDAIINVTSDTKKVADTIVNHMLKTRPQKTVRNIPYTKCGAYTSDKPLGRLHINLRELYPDAAVGDMVYSDFNLQSETERDIIVTLSANAHLLQDGTRLYCGDGTDDEVKITAKLKVGDNIFSVRSECKPDKFGFTIMLSTPEYWFMWARDLLGNFRNTIPVAERKNEEGFAFSRVYKKDETDEMAAFEAGDKCYKFPIITEVGDDKDFNTVYAQEKGNVAYALSYAKADGSAELFFVSDAVVFVNGEERYKCTQGERLILDLKSGDEVLIKSLRQDKWGFSCKDDIFHMPYIESNRGNGDKWLFLGTFGRGTGLELAYSPENGISFTTPYFDAEKKKVFWRLADGGYIRAYLDTFFFGQWYYALMVGHFGLLNTYRAFGDRRLYDYFNASMDIIASYYSYAKYDGVEFETNPSMLPRTYSLRELDPVGTMGMNLTEAYFNNGNPSAMAVINELENVLYGSAIPKFSDGVINRVSTMWSDDLFMGCPFMVRLGLLKNDEKHFDMAYTQFKGFYDRMFIHDLKLFSHIYFVEDKEKSNVTWGRGNGWVMVALADFLENVPKTYKHYDDVADMFRKMSEGVADVQDERGMWHQVLDHPESFIESSCTAMFLFALSKGITLGILDKKYIENADRAYRAILEHFVDKDGNIYGVCMGSGCRRDWQYYSEHLKTIKNEDHGTGIILAAVSAYDNVKKS